MKTVFRYRFLDNLKSLAGLVAALLLADLLTVVFMKGDMNGANSLAGAIWALVIGIVVSRGDVRLGNQFGVSRRSAFLGTLLGGAASFAAAAAALTALTAVLRLLSDGSGVIVMDFYQLLYGGPSYAMSAADYGAMALLKLSVFLCLGFFGMLCSLAFWRVGKFGSWVLGAGMGLFFILGIPNLLDRVPALLRPLRILTTDPLAMGLFLVVLAAVFLLGSWLLLRRAAILAPAKS